jgi:hypothetical protein
MKDLLTKEHEKTALQIATTAGRRLGTTITFEAACWRPLGLRLAFRLPSGVLRIDCTQEELEDYCPNATIEIRLRQAAVAKLDL